MSSQKTGSTRLGSISPLGLIHVRFSAGMSLAQLSPKTVHVRSGPTGLPWSCVCLSLSLDLRVKTLCDARRVFDGSFHLKLLKLWGMAVAWVFCFWKPDFFFRGRGESLRRRFGGEVWRRRRWRHLTRGRSSFCLGPPWRSSPSVLAVGALLLRTFTAGR